MFMSPGLRYRCSQTTDTQPDRQSERERGRQRTELSLQHAAHNWGKSATCWADEDPRSRDSWIKAWDSYLNRRVPKNKWSSGIDRAGIEFEFPVPCVSLSLSRSPVSRLACRLICAQLNKQTCRGSRSDTCCRRQNIWECILPLATTSRHPDKETLSPSLVSSVAAAQATRDQIEQSADSKSRREKQREEENNLNCILSYSGLSNAKL